MSGLNYINNGYATTGASIASGDPNPLTIALTAGHGARMPAASSSAGSWFIGALIDEPPNNIEIVKVYNRSTDTCTALRAWGGTTAKTWSSGTRFVALGTEKSMESELLDLLQVRAMATASGTANALTASVITGHTVLQSAMRMAVKITITNTAAAPTLNLTFDASSFGGTTTASGVKPIVLQGDNYCGPGDLSANMLADLIYNSTYQSAAGAWVLQNPAGRPGAPGEVVMTTSSALPPGAWFAADGAVKSQTTYAKLYAAIGTAFNTGSEGAGNFRLPNFKGRSPMGTGQGNTAEGGGLGTTRTRGQLVGSETHTLVTAQLAAHTHPPGGGSNQFLTDVSGSTPRGAIGTGYAGFESTGSAGSGAAHPNVHPVLVVPFAIRY